MTTVMTAELTAAKDALAEVEYLLDSLHLALATPAELDQLEADVNELLYLIDTAEIAAALDQQPDPADAPKVEAFHQYLVSNTPLEDWLLDELAEGWRLSKRGKPLTGAALAARRRKVSEQLVSEWVQAEEARHIL